MGGWNGRQNSGKGLYTFFHPTLFLLKGEGWLFNRIVYEACYVSFKPCSLPVPFYFHFFPIVCSCVLCDNWLMSSYLWRNFTKKMCSCRSEHIWNSTPWANTTGNFRYSKQHFGILFFVFDIANYKWLFSIGNDFYVAAFERICRP